MKNSHGVIVILTHFGSVCGVGSTPPIQHHLGFSRFRCVRSTFPVCLTDRLAMVVVCSERDVWYAHSGRMCDCNVHEVFHEFKIKLVNQLCIRRERNVSDWKKREKQNNWFNFPTVALFLEAKDVLISYSRMEIMRDWWICLPLLGVKFNHLKCSNVFVS